MNLYNELKINKFFFITLAILSLMIPLMLGFEKYKFAASIFLFPVLIYFAFIFEKHYRLLFILSIFIGYYIEINSRIQIVNLISYGLIIYFIFNFSTNSFNKFKLPKFIKYISIFLIIAVFTSAVNSPFISVWSIYYSVMFFIYIFTGYVIFRSVIDADSIVKYTNYFYKSVSFYSIFVILQIIITGHIRSFGLSGPTFSDIIAMALIIVIFQSYISGNFDKFSLYHIIILFIVLITTLSRFSWIGFASTFIFGLILVSITQTKILFSKRSIYVLGSIILLVIIIFAIGLHNVILNRLLDVNLSVLDNSKEEGMVSNSLDTRVLIWMTALNAFLNNMYTGVGYFMFHKVSYSYNLFPEQFYIDYVMGLDPHSTFLGILTETGIFGFITFFIYLLTAFVLSLKSIKYSINSQSKNSSLILSILLFFIISTSFYSGAFTFGYNAYVLHLVVGITLANYTLNKINYDKSKKIYPKTI